MQLKWNVKQSIRIIVQPRQTLNKLSDISSIKMFMHI